MKQLAAEGWAVAIHCHRSGQEAKALARAIQAAGARAAILEADLADAAAVSSIIAQAAAALGPLTLLVDDASSSNRTTSAHSTRSDGSGISA